MTTRRRRRHHHWWDICPPKSTTSRIPQTRGKTDRVLVMVSSFVCLQLRCFYWKQLPPHSTVLAMIVMHEGFSCRKVQRSRNDFRCNFAHSFFPSSVCRLTHAICQHTRIYQFCPSFCMEKIRTFINPHFSRSFLTITINNKFFNMVYIIYFQYNCDIIYRNPCNFFSLVQDNFTFSVHNSSSEFAFLLALNKVIIYFKYPVRYYIFM